MNEYIVLGPVMEGSEWNDQAGAYEPPEKYRPYVEVEAPNARTAMKLALAKPQFKDIAETSDTVPWKYVRVIRHPHNPPEHDCPGEEWDGAEDEECPACPVCTAFEKQIAATEARIDELCGWSWE